MKKIYTKFDEWINEMVTPKDLDRINSLVSKAKGDEAKAVQLATAMANSIGDMDKLRQRHEAAVEILGADHPATKVFADKMASSGVKPADAKKKGNTLGALGSEVSTPSTRSPFKGRRPNPVLPLGSTNLVTGKCDYFNIYDTWGNGDGTTIELWRAFKSGPGVADGAWKLVFTSGSKAITGIGDAEPFVHDQTQRDLFYGELVDWANIGDADLLVRKYGVKSASGYVYK